MIEEDKEKKYELLSKYLRSGSVVDDEELFIEFQKDKEFQKWYNMYFQFVGVTGWLIVGIMWEDWALIVVNIIGSLILLIGILHYHFFTDWYLTIYSRYLEVMI